MPILVPGLRIGFRDAVDDAALEEQAVQRAEKLLHLSSDVIRSAKIWKKSLDARRRGGSEPSFVVSVRLELDSSKREKAIAEKMPSVTRIAPVTLELSHGEKSLDGPVFVAGFGPAGIFAADLLAKQGYRPIVLERGGSIGERADAVGNFWKTGHLDPEMNVQFGEGGAGTFSDGKLTTRISDPRCGYVLETLVRHGASEEILHTAHPHIGTDKLRDVIVSMRREIIACGGEVRFHSRLEGIGVRNGRVVSVRVNGADEPAGALLLAIGHSARDTFQMLYDSDISLEPKPFSVGVRIEQLQSTIDRGLYGNMAGDPRLPVGEYQLSHREPDGRCVYTFCMCPGGYVVPSASAVGGVVTNGMSYHARDGKNANAALVVSVGAEDFGDGSPLCGVRFQETLEQAAYHMGQNSYRAPAMTVRQFLERESSAHVPFVLGSVEPTYALGVENGDFDRLFPEPIPSMLRMGLRSFDRKLHGFSDGDGILTGVETRTSSPVRILRSMEGLESLSVSGLYPCGEGAGYAGGIVSAAADGLRAAQAVISAFRVPECRLK